MPRRSRLSAPLIALALAGLALSGCAAEAEPLREVTAAPEAEETESPEPTPEPEPEPRPYEYALDCTVDTGSFDYRDTGRFPTFEAAWADGRQWVDCSATRIRGDEYSDFQRAAVAAAGYDDIESVDTLYGLCGELAGFYVTDGVVSEAQAQEVAGMLTLCPSFPFADALRASSGAAQQAAAERAAGTRISGGLFVIGQGVQPGLYQTTGPVEDCYWELLDGAGEIIDNNFISAAAQVQITVPASAFSLSVNRCGELVRIG